MNTFTNVSDQIDAKTWVAFILCWLAGSFAGMESSLFSVTLPQVVPELIMSNDKSAVGQVGSYMLSSFLIGWIFGGILFGYVGDRFGRVKAMAASIFLYAGFSGIAAMSNEAWQFALCRLMTGVGVGGAMVSISIFLSEVWPSRSRAVAVGALITSYQVGMFLASLLCSFFPEWRHAFALGALPSLLGFVVPMILDEPEQWKNAKQCETRKTNQLKNLFSGDLRKSICVGGAAFGGLLIGYWASLSWIPTWIHELVGDAGTGQEKFTATIYHAVAAIIGCCVAGYLVNRFGRVKIIMAAMIGSFAVSVWMFVGNSAFSTFIYFQNGLLGFFIGLAQAAMYIYLPELFPTHVRASGVGFCLNAGRIFTAIAVLFVGMLVPIFGGYSNALLAFSCFYMVGTAAICWSQETKQ